MEIDDGWVTAPNLNRFSVSNEKNRRTSTPAPGKPLFNEKEENFLNQNKNSYLSWKKHLAEPKNVFKLRGATINSSDIISGHIVRRNTVKDDLPLINNNFINLILNQPSSEDLISTKHENKLCKHTKWSPICYQFCECNKFSSKNVDLPIGYKIDDNGFISQNRPTLYKEIIFKN